MVEGVGEEVITVSGVIVDSISVLVGGSGVVVMPCVSSTQSLHLSSFFVLDLHLDVEKFRGDVGRI